MSRERFMQIEVEFELMALRMTQFVLFTERLGMKRVSESWSYSETKLVFLY